MSDKKRGQNQGLLLDVTETSFVSEIDDDSLSPCLRMRAFVYSCLRSRLEIESEQIPGRKNNNSRHAIPVIRSSTISSCTISSSSSCSKCRDWLQSGCDGVYISATSVVTGCSLVVTVSIYLSNKVYMSMKMISLEFLVRMTVAVVVSSVIILAYYGTYIRYSSHSHVISAVEQPQPEVTEDIYFSTLLYKQKRQRHPPPAVAPQKRKTDNTTQCKFHENVAFMKIHKCGSSTTQNIFLRFGHVHRLLVALPKGEDKPQIGRFGKITEDDYEAPPRGTRWNVFAHHAVYNRSGILRLMPEDTKFVAILREPVDRFLSAFIYFKMAKYFPGMIGSSRQPRSTLDRFKARQKRRQRRIAVSNKKGPPRNSISRHTSPVSRSSTLNPAILQYLQNPARWDNIYRPGGPTDPNYEHACVRNCMVRDLGFPESLYENSEAIDRHGTGFYEVDIRTAKLWKYCVPVQGSLQKGEDVQEAWEFGSWQTGELATGFELNRGIAI
ncbi:hypothetical protein Bbelb_059010 [Branchiostoma belcheri]|nr:hypothetical protein Bbelb_059010 [Branchiostoma belcheri]